MSRNRAAKIFALLAILAGPALAAQTVDVIQNGRAFNVSDLKIARGTVVRFLNQDEFIHHVFVDAADFKFDSGEQVPGQVIELPFTKSGTFVVSCAIHPKMHLVVEVH